MGKLFWQISSSVDGFMSGPQGELDRTAEFTEPEFEQYAAEMLRSIGGFVIGRKTYELFVNYWPDAEGEDADRLNSLPKLVVSTTLDTVEWNNATLVKDNIADAVRRFKSEAENDVAVFGSSQLAWSLLRGRVVDEIRILTTPFLLGNGRSTFSSKSEPHQLKLTRSEAWPLGTTVQYYEPIYK